MINKNADDWTWWNPSLNSSYTDCSTMSYAHHYDEVDIEYCDGDFMIRYGALRSELLRSLYGN